MPKNLHDSKRNRPSAITSIKTNKHKVVVQKHITEHKHLYQNAPTKTHDHHSHLKRRCVHEIMQQDDQLKSLINLPKDDCITLDELARKNKHRRNKKGKKRYSQYTFKFLDLALAHPQGLHDALTKLSHKSKGMIDVRIYVHK